MRSLTRAGPTLGKLSVPSLAVVFCGVFILQTHELPTRSVTFPWLVIGAIVLLAVLLVIDALRRPRAEVSDAPAPPADPDTTTAPGRPGLARSIRPFIMPASLLAFIVALPHIGIHAAAALFVAVTLPLLGYRSPVRLACSVAAVLLVVHVVFIHLFRLPLPGRW